MKNTEEQAFTMCYRVMLFHHLRCTMCVEHSLKSLLVARFHGVV